MDFLDLLVSILRFLVGNNQRFDGFPVPHITVLVLLLAIALVPANKGVSFASLGLTDQ